MLNYVSQYNVSYGVFLTFKNNLSKRNLSVNHKQAKIDALKTLFPYSKYESFTKENFTAACLYIMYYKSPSSFNKMLDYLHNIDIKDVFAFKHNIINYPIYIEKDINYLREKYSNPSLSNVLDELKNNKIQFFSTFFYLKCNNIDIDELINKSRVLGNMLQRLKQLMLFITFREEAINKINVLFNESNILKGTW